MNRLPWLLPVALIAFAVSIATAATVARMLRSSRIAAWLTMAGLGIAVAATLTPFRPPFETASRLGTCDFSRLGLASPEQMLRGDDVTLNVLLLVPLGVGLGLVPLSRRKVAAVLAAIALPFLIELTQAFMPFLQRACESADVADNLTGLAIGLGLGTPLGWLGRRRWGTGLGNVEQRT